MARSYYGPALAFGTLADVLGSGLRGLAEGREDVLRREFARLQMEQMQQGMTFGQAREAREAERFPLELETGRAGLEATRAQERRAGELHPLDVEVKRRALTLPTYEKLSGGWVKKTAPDGEVTYSQPTNPERMDEALAELKKVRPDDVWGQAQVYMKYRNELGGLKELAPYLEQRRFHEGQQANWAANRAEAIRSHMANEAIRLMQAGGKIPPVTQARLKEIENEMRFMDRIAHGLEDPTRMARINPVTRKPWTPMEAAMRMQELLEEHQGIVAGLQAPAAGGAAAPSGPYRPGAFTQEWLKGKQ